MMTNDKELDNLKNAWKTISESVPEKEYSAEELKKMVKKRSNNELSKIRRKLIIEWTLALALSVYLVLFIHFINPADTKYALIFVLVILGISFFPYMNIIHLKLSNHPDLRTYLAEFISRFDKLVKQYVRMATVLIPVAGLGGFLLGYHSGAGEAEWSSFFQWLNVLLVAVFVLLISLGGFWMIRRYFKWIYGKNIQRLRACLADLEEAEKEE
ncbi:MAG: hypothetical protein JEZ09_19135 [Salinivirgaceae bacterium]|nr:hypothetical protein [Salinivirgaceae bacterium]